ncbi:MAG TPA: hypothetical protein GXZ23_05305 [Clostridiales bacterium]|nr:hypothetical protein [Clostridiales bacterium]
MNETIKAIIERRTIRDYTDQQISDEQLNILLDSAIWAPSARNKQPLLIRVLQGKDILDKMNFDFKETVGWDTPAYTRYNENPVHHNAPTMIFLFADSENSCAMDAGIMVENIAIAAESIGLGTAIIGSVRELFGGQFADKWYDILDIPKTNPFMIAISVGYKAENPEPKERKENMVKIIK